MKKLCILNEKGNALIITFIIVMVVMIYAISSIFMVSHETQMTVSHNRKIKAFYLAEAGIERAIWKLQESDLVWDETVAGTPPAGFDGTQEFTDIAEGLYKITVTPGSSLSTLLGDQVTVLSQGKDSSDKEVRSIQAVLSKYKLSTAFVAGGSISNSPNFIIHWGPVLSFGDMSLTGGAVTRHFPRKFAQGAIAPDPPYDVIDDADNTNNVDYWAWEDSMGNPPLLDLEEYIRRAKASIIPLASGGGNIRKNPGNTPAVADPVGSGYFPSDENPEGIRFFGPYDFECVDSTSVIFVDSIPEFGRCILEQRSFLKLGALIVTGDLVFQADGRASYPVTIPVGASKEYQHPDAQPVWNTFDPPGEGGVYTVSNCGFHGFIYVGGTFNGRAGGGATMVGSLYAPNVNETQRTNTFTIYYDPMVVREVLFSDNTVHQVSWQEVPREW